MWRFFSRPLSTPTHDHDHPDIPPPALEQVSDGIYAYVQLDGSWGLNNSGFLVGRDAVTVIDSCFTERRTRALIDTIESVTPLPLRTLVNRYGRNAISYVMAKASEPEKSVEAEDEAVRVYARAHNGIGDVHVENVGKEILKSRALVLPSFAEGLPVVLMEALALARPVLTTYIAGIPELVEDGVNGWLIPAGSIDALVEKIRKTLETPVEILSQMGTAGGQRVAEQHNARVEASKLASLMKSPGELA